MVPFIVSQTSFWFAVGVLVGFILYIIIRRALAVVGTGILATVIGSFLQPLGSGMLGYLGYVVGTVGVGVMAAGFVIFLIKFAMELISNTEFAPYRL